MSKNKVIFNAQEKRTRLNWLLSAVVISIVVPLIEGGMDIIDMYLEGGLVDKPAVISLFFVFIPFFLTYFFAYKRRGTKLLLLQLILGTAVYIKRIIREFSETNGDYFLIGVCVLLSLIFCWWWIASYKLRALNMKYKPVKLAPLTLTD